MVGSAEGAILGMGILSNFSFFFASGDSERFRNFLASDN